MCGQAATAQNDVDQRAPSTPVAVDKGVDGFELGMANRRLRDRRQRVQIAERTEIVEKLLNLLMRRRHEGGGTRVVTAPADPVLLRTNLAGVLIEPSSGKQVLVNSKNVVGGDLLLRIAELLDRPVHGFDVVEHLERSNVGWLLAKDSLRLSAKESTSSDFEAFYPRRGDSLGAQQESRYRLRVDETSRLQVETDDSCLGVGDVSSGLPCEDDRPADKAIGHVRFVGAALTVPARETGRQVGGPATA